MTAVEWLIQQFELHYNGENDLYYNEFIDQAKQLEKQQIIDAYKFGLSDEYVIGSDKYYTSTYGSKGSDETSSKTTSDKWKEYQDWLNEVPEISDEEIEDRAAEWMEEDWDVKTYYEAFIDGASWYREQLKQRQ